MLKKALVIGLAFMISIGFFAILDTEAEAADYTIRVGYADRDIWLENPEEEPVPDPQTAFALVFESIVEQETDGDIEVERYPESALGTEGEMVEMVQAGTLDISAGAGMMGPYFPEFQVINLPYAFESAAHANYFLEHSEFWNDLMEEMEEEMGVKLLGVSHNGFRNITSNETLVKEPEDMEGQRIRVMDSPVFVEQFEAVGADPVPMAWEELYTSLEAGVVDAQENPISVINLGALYEVQDYLTLNAHTYSANVFLMNEDLFADLPEEYQTVVREAAYTANNTGHATEQLASRVAHFDVMEEEFEDIYSPTAEEIDAFRDAKQPAVQEWLEDELGEEIVVEFIEEVERTAEEFGH